MGGPAFTTTWDTPSAFWAAMEATIFLSLVQGAPSFYRHRGHIARLLASHRGCHLLVISSRGHLSFYTIGGTLPSSWAPCPSPGCLAHFLDALPTSWAPFPPPGQPQRQSSSRHVIQGAPQLPNCSEGALPASWVVTGATIASSSAMKAAILSRGCSVLRCHWGPLARLLGDLGGHHLVQRAPQLPTAAGGFLPAC
jgi:hypothetical protein